MPTPYRGDWGPEYAPEKPLNVASAPQRGASFHSRRRKSQRPIGEWPTPYRGINDAAPCYFRCKMPRSIKLYLWEEGERQDVVGACPSLFFFAYNHICVARYFGFVATAKDIASDVHTDHVAFTLVFSGSGIILD